MNHGNKKKMEMGGSFDEMLRAYELSLLDETRVPDEEEIPSFSERTSDDFQLGEIVWDTEKGEYGVVIGIYYGQTGDDYEVRLDSSGMQPVDILRKRGELGDSGNAMDLLSAIVRYERLLNTFPEYTHDYPPILNKPKMAKGGTLELDPKQAKKAFHLPIEMAIYVPSTSDVDKVISDSEMKKRVTEVSTYLSNIFGGYTSQETIGGYVDSKGNLVNEDVVRVVSFGATDKFEKNKAKILKKIAEWCSKWSQEAIGFEVEGDLYYIPENFAKGGNIRKYYNADPRMIIAKFDTTCAETGKPIKKGESCIYYPKTKQCYSLSSKQAKEFREYMSDLDMGYNYAKGGNVRKYANGGSVFYIPYTTEFSFKHKDDMDGIRRVSTFTKQIDSSIAFEEARTIAEEAIDERLSSEGYDKDDISEIEVDDFYLGMPEEDDEKKFRGEVGIEENDEMLPEIERSGRWGDEYALLCDELANYNMGGRIKNALKNRFGKSKRGDVEIMDVEEIQESNNPQDMMQTLNYDPQMILSALKEAKDLAPETARSLDLYMASKIRNKQKWGDFLNATPNELLGRSFAVGGEVKFVDLSDNQSPRTIWESRKSKNTKQNSFGAFAHRINKKYIGDYYLYRLSDFDEDFYSHIPLKNGEILARIETDDMVGGEMPLVKINVDNGRVYFMSDDNDRFSDEDEKNPKFDRASADVIYLSLDKAILNYVDSKHKFALGGLIKNKVYGDVFVLKSKKYTKDPFLNTYETKEYYQTETEVLSKRLANRLVQILKERNITPSNITDKVTQQEIEYKIPLTDGTDGFIILTLSSHRINKRLSQIVLEDIIEDWHDKYGFRYLYAKGGEVEQQYKMYSAILEGSLEEDPLDYARGMDWMSSEYEMVDSLPTYHRYVDTINGIDVYYDYGADYYFFVESDDPQMMAKGGEVDGETYTLPQSLKERKRDFQIIDNRGEKEGLEIYEDGSGKWYVENKKTGLIADFRTKAEAQEGIRNPDWDYGEGEPIIAE